MTNYRIVSDLHTEMWAENPRKTLRMIDTRIPIMEGDADTILLLPGDTGSYRRKNTYAVVINHLCDRFRLVIDIPGNHFWYGGTDWRIDHAPVKRDNYVFGQSFVSDGIVATTLWSDFRGGDPLIETQCMIGMNDFKQIPNLSPQMVKDRYAEQLAFLIDNITPGCVVMTHFAPSRRSTPAYFERDPLSNYYASNLDDLIERTRPALWVHGHIHTFCDYVIGETRIVCNPAGYDGADHDPRFQINV